MIMKHERMRSRGSKGAGRHGGERKSELRAVEHRDYVVVVIEINDYYKFESI